MIIIYSGMPTSGKTRTLKKDISEYKHDNFVCIDEGDYFLKKNPDFNLEQFLNEEKDLLITLLNKKTILNKLTSKQMKFIKIKEINMKQDTLNSWLQWREKFKNMTEEEKKDWDEDIEELNRQRYRPYLNDLNKGEVRDALNNIYIHCQDCNDNNDQVSLTRIKEQLNRILTTLELGEMK